MKKHSESVSAFLRPNLTLTDRELEALLKPSNKPVSVLQVEEDFDDQYGDILEAVGAGHGI